ncbi:MAG: dTDP-4-amino-4,6-dideoxygalactose transaminase [Bacteroidia bacterium]|nr:dTDP-4-amino-4,6-dideoxygalactose transaminase [Bacteroidia bacterium]
MIPFNQPYYSGNEKANIATVMGTKVLTGDTEVSLLCEQLLEKKYKFKKVFLTNSCTNALEIAAMLMDIQPGDEVILPSYTFVSTSNAFALRGAKLVFADSKSDHPNIDEVQIEKLINSKTKAIVVVHYAGVACNMDAIIALAKKNGIRLIEDAAQCIDSFYNKRALGTLGDIACFSFHETKNIHCGEGGFIAINDASLIERADVLRNKGTNRSAFFSGQVKKYEWVDIGLSAIPSAISTAFLYAQLLDIDKVQLKRKKIWERYFRNLTGLNKSGKVKLPLIPDYASNNAHIFYLICKDKQERDELILYLKKNEIQAVFHYQSLHRSPYYLDKHDGRVLSNADYYSDCLLRLPLFYDLSLKEVDYISEKIIEFYK